MQLKLGTRRLYTGLYAAVIATGIQSALYYLWYSVFRAVHAISTPRGTLAASVHLSDALTPFSPP